MALQMPKFANETDEAKWWYDNRDELADEMIAAMRAGRTGPGVVARLRAKLAAQEAIKKENEISSVAS